MGLKKELLEAPRSPEQLDRAVRITSSRAWISALLLGAVGLFVLVWGIFGSIETRVSGLGLILPKGGKVFSIAAENGGTVLEVKVQEGQSVKKDQVLALLDQATDRSVLEAAEAKLENLRVKLEGSTKYAEELKQKKAETTQSHIKNYTLKITELTNRMKEKQASLATLREDLKKGYITRDQLDQTQSEIDDSRFQILDLREKITSAEEELYEYIDAQNKGVADNMLAVRNQDIEVRRLIEAEENDEILRATTDGIISELDIVVGDQLRAGQVVANVLSENSEMTAETFFRASDGKQIVPGMRTFVAISSAEPAIYGKAVGRVTEVSRLPVTSTFIKDLVKNEELAQSMMSDGAPIHVRISFENDPETTSGIAWSSFKGPPFVIDSGTLVTPTVVVSTQPPINYVAPFLPEHIGLAGDIEK